MRKERNNDGFTLVELIIVVAIIALLIAMIAPNLTSFLGTASDTTYRANAKTAFTASNAWATQMRVAGAAGAAGTVTLELNGDVLQATYTDVTAPTGSQPALEDLFNAGEFNADTVVTVTVDANWAVTNVVWAEAGTSSTYPDAGASPTATP
jgi:prepilin-type N-terminal cleavage/methylation domain-containing protein